MLRKRKPVEPVTAPPADDAGEILRRKLAEADEAVAAARTAYHDAVLDAELSPSPAAEQRKEAAAAALKAAQARVEELRGAMAAHAARQEQRRAQEAQADFGRRKAATLELVAKREQLGPKYHAAMTTLAEIRREILSINTEIASTCPVADMDLDAGLLRAADIDIAARLALGRAGVPWGPHLPVEPSSLPTIAERIARANAEIVTRLENAAP